ncbi:BTB/POZ domain-containing protein KCTD18-like [Pontoporia blainvillei]|uniref:BTB/POZ domain-containing protein KCTD18-like n=1 Tax=Pontoporia blainvillei TaxID=48723 RepID=A0ABX0S0N5_PONBL|nr:BTB/POZ domain-containing protein KCTD18-like [Pontoporia blainvillei]
MKLFALQAEIHRLKKEEQQPEEEEALVQHKLPSYVSNMDRLGDSELAMVCSQRNASLSQSPRVGFLSSLLPQSKKSPSRLLPAQAPPQAQSSAKKESFGGQVSASSAFLTLRQEASDIPLVRRPIAPNEEEEGGVNCKTGPKPVRFLGPSTSTQIKVKNSASVRVPPASVPQPWSRASVNPAAGGRAAQRSALLKAPSPLGTGLPGHPQAAHGTGGAENGATHPPPAKVLLSDKKATPHRVIKLKRTPLCAAGPSTPACTAARPAGPPEPNPDAPSALGTRTENGQGQTD